MAAAPVVPESWRVFFDAGLHGFHPSPAAIAAWNALPLVLQAEFEHRRTWCNRQIARIHEDDDAINNHNTVHTLNNIVGAYPMRWDSWLSHVRYGLDLRTSLRQRLTDFIAESNDFLLAPGRQGMPPWHPNILASAAHEQNWALNLRHPLPPMIALLDGHHQHPPVPIDIVIGVQKIPVHYLQDNWRRRRLRALVLPAVVEENKRDWQGAWMLGNGGMSNTALWIRTTPDANVVCDRVFIKQCSMADLWTDAIYWHGNVRHLDARLPMEIACQRAMQSIKSKKTKAEMVPLVRHWEIDNVTKEFVMYTNYCSFGNLYDMAIPRSILWHVFCALAEACLAMEKGHVDARAGAAAADGWQQIIHRDIKLPNIFLNTKSRAWFQMYPKIILGDFGLAIRTSPGDPLNPDCYNGGAGTTGFFAPESRQWVDLAHGHQPTARPPILAKTNIWAVGQIMYCLIAYDDRPQQMDYMGDGTDPNTTPNVAGNNPSGFSATLVDLVQECLECDPGQRPSPQALIARINAAIDTDGVDGGGLARGLQNPMGLSTRVERNAAGNQLRVPRDDYMLKMSGVDLPPM